MAYSSTYYLLDRYPPGNEIVPRVFRNAARNSIDLNVLPFIGDALLSIVNISHEELPELPTFAYATHIDTHTHPVPSWFRELQPMAAGRETPSWSISAHLSFMNAHNIKRSILSFSTPQANAYPGDRERTVALARLLNEFAAEVARVFPERLSWMAVLPLPYVEESVKEASYALGELNAAGVCVLTNHEGVYPGDAKFDPLWRYLHAYKPTVVFVHPTEPVIRLADGSLVNSKPSPLRSGLGEFYFETARAISSLTENRTFMKYQTIRWRIAHGAGAFPDIQDRFLLGFPDIAENAKEAYATRFWYDSAGPVYPRQIKGLLAHDVPVSQLVFGTDYPYGIGFWDVDTNIDALTKADFLSLEEKNGIFFGNAERLWQGII